MTAASTLAEQRDGEYALGAGESERKRLLEQCEIHRGQAERLFARLGVAPGARAGDLGCGPLGVLDVLSGLVGPSGEVIGLDSEPRMISHAQRTIDERNLPNVSLVVGDASSTGLASGSFEVVHERLVLINHRCPEAIVDEMVRLAAPGGWVVVEEVDHVSWMCEPTHPAWERLKVALHDAWRAAASDLFIGRRLPSLLGRSGLTEVGCDVHAHLWRAGDLYQTLLLRFVDIFRERILEAGLLGESELDDLAGELERHLAKSDTFVTHPLFFQAWGKKPARLSKGEETNV
jgi:ubiquinone/menaquinone biosynthesis C-methylase UbiE